MGLLARATEFRPLSVLISLIVEFDVATSAFFRLPPLKD